VRRPSRWPVSGRRRGRAGGPCPARGTVRFRRASPRWRRIPGRRGLRWRPGTGARPRSGCGSGCGKSRYGGFSGPVQVTFVAQAGFGRAIGAEGVGVVDQPAALGAGPHPIQLPHHRGQGPAAEPAPHRPHDQRGVQQVTGTAGAGSVMQQQHPQVGGNRVEPAAVHDPRTSAGGRVVAAVDAVPDEQHLAGQVRVIGARLGTGLNQRQAAGALTSSS
jgi:hypothetical protein